MLPACSEHSNNKLTASSLSVTEVDGLLDELAATCAFSDTTIRRLHTRQQSKYNILCRLYDSVTPLDASFLTQIILKDLRPLLYPASYGHYTAALTKLNSNSVVMLGTEGAMMAGEPSGEMLNTYRVRCSLGEASKAFEASKCDFLMVPQVGIPIEVEGCSLVRMLALNRRNSDTKIREGSRVYSCSESLQRFKQGMG